MPGTRFEVDALAHRFNSESRPCRVLLAADAAEPELDRLATAGELGRFGFLDLATHGVIDEGGPLRSAVLLTQTGLPDPCSRPRAASRSSTASSRCARSSAPGN